MVVTEHQHAGTGKEVEKDVAIGVGEIGAVPVADRNRGEPWISSCRRFDSRLLVEQPLRLFAGNCSDDSCAHATSVIPASPLVLGDAANFQSFRDLHK